jgi:nucleoside-diphosphate-sugar epimerase
MMKIFMTGGTGFVGTYLVGQFIREEHKVTILTPPLTGSELKAYSWRVWFRPPQRPAGDSPPPA